MSDSALRLRNRGAYTNPFSGVGVEFFPLGVPPDHSGFVLHEAAYLPKNDWWNFPNVLSPFWRLYYNGRRGHKVVFSNSEVELMPEKIVVIPDRQLFHCVGHKPAPHLWLTFSISRRLAAGQSIPIVLCPTSVERSLMREFTRLFSDNVPSQSEDHDRIFHAAMAVLHVVLARPEIKWRQGVPPAVVQTIQYIEEHYARPIVIPQLARMVDLCTESLARSFKKHQGETIGRFVVKVRVREAAHLLTHTDVRIEEIAERTGFPNRAYLSRVFRRVTGESPAEFRRRHGS